MQFFKTCLLTVLLLSSVPIFASTGNNINEDQDLAFSRAVMGIAMATQASIESEMDSIESISADILRAASQEILSDPEIIAVLARNAKHRYLIDQEASEDVIEADFDRYANLAMGSLQTALRQTPGVMTQRELTTRARLLSHIARFYSRRDASMCRYLPQDISLLLNVDAPWIEFIDESLAEQAILDERNAIKRVLGGTMPIIINDADVQLVFSRFAGEWFSGLDDQSRQIISQSRSKGDYCDLWQKLLTDSANMAESFPAATHRVLLPLLTMPTRGWLDVGLWGLKQAE